MSLPEPVRGEVWDVDFPDFGRHPAVVLSVNALNSRLGHVAVVPVTGTSGVGALYPALSAGTSGLTKTSCALVDHLRSIDKRRVRRIFGQVSPSDLAGIDQGLELFLGLGAAS